jgi:hypothetical protein
MANAALLIRSFDLIIFDAVAFSTERPAFFHQLRSLIGKPHLIVIGDVILSEIEEVMQVGYDYIASEKIAGSLYGAATTAPIRRLRSVKDTDIFSGQQKVFEPLTEVHAQLFAHTTNGTDIRNSEDLFSFIVNPVEPPTTPLKAVN